MKNCYVGEGKNDVLDVYLTNVTWVHTGVNLVYMWYWDRLDKYLYPGLDDGATTASSSRSRSSSDSDLLDRVRPADDPATHVGGQFVGRHRQITEAFFEVGGQYRRNIKIL